jgi:hypothetical protein
MAAGRADYTPKPFKIVQASADIEYDFGQCEKDRFGKRGDVQIN